MTPIRCAISFGCGAEALGLEAIGFLLEIEEQLALRLRGADFHQPPVVDEVAIDVSANPPHRVGGKSDPAIGVEILDRFHQPDVALLDEVEQVLGGARELHCDLHHQAQIRGD